MNWRFNPTMKTAWTILALVCFIQGTCDKATAQEVLTPRQPIPTLAHAQTILLTTSVFKAEEKVNPWPLVQTIAHRLREVGYSVVTDPTQSHDVAVQFRCQEPDLEGWRGLPPGANFLESSGPPCVLSYSFEGKPITWQRIDTIVFSEGVQAAEQAATTMEGPGPGPLPASTRFLEHFDFPLLLSAEWGQVDRLLTLLDDPETSLERKRKIVKLLGEIRADQACPRITQALQDQFLIVEATYALGSFGAKARPHLIRMLQNSPNLEVQVAAAHSLGRVLAAMGDTSLTLFLLEFLTSPDVDMRVQIEIVWALGKAPDFRAHPVLEKLQSQIWQIRSNDPELQKLRAAVDWSIREVRQGGHTDAYY